MKAVKADALRNSYHDVYQQRVPSNNVIKIIESRYVLAVQALALASESNNQQKSARGSSRTACNYSANLLRRESPSGHEWDACLPCLVNASELGRVEML